MSSIKKTWKAIRRNFRSFRKNRAYRARFHFTRYYEKEPIDEKAIFFESYSANNFSGNVFYIYKAIADDPRLKEYRKVIACNRKNHAEVQSFLEFHGFTDFELVEVHSHEYCRAIATAKYLFNNSTLPVYFIKRPEQVFFNTWHGTPLKTLGRSIISAPNEIGNTQRNFFMADYLLYPNEFTFEHMREDYMLNELFPGKYALNGYPRNYVFYQTSQQEALRRKLELTDKQVIAYMPTWRGTVARRSVQEQLLAVRYFLMEIDKRLRDDQVFYVNLHNFLNAELEFDGYKHILPFPKEYETYEFLSIADCLVTDYSSVFFDFANTGRKIVLFAYDEDEYFATRGVYIPYEELPFPRADTVQKLIREINDPVTRPYPEFVKRFDPWDDQDTAAMIRDQIFFGSNELHLIDGTSYRNGKRNVLIFGGSLAQNGLTTSLRGLLNHLDTEKYNFFVMFFKQRVQKYNYVISDFPKGISYISIQGWKDITIMDAFCQLLYYRFNITSGFVMDHIDRMFQREAKRIFAGNQFSDVIHFTGYERNIAALFGQMKDTHSVIYVHNDMRKEKDTRSNYHIPSILRAYRDFDNIVAIRESMVPEIMDLVPGIPQDKIKVVHNVNNIERILENSALPLAFDENTESTHTVEEIREILDDASVFKFIDVARYSPEKGLKRLILAFEDFSRNHPDSALFVIGGHGGEYRELCEYCQEHALKNVILIQSLSNPFPILAKCDCFILSSFYEGLPMSIMEALILDKPVVSTNITGPREFLEQGYGELVEDSQQGLYDGMVKAYDHELDLKPFDARAFNEQALQEFYQILK